MTRTRKHAIEWLTLFAACCSYLGSGQASSEVSLIIGFSQLGWDAYLATHVMIGRYEYPPLIGGSLDALEAAARLREGRRLSRRTGEWTWA